MPGIFFLRSVVRSDVLSSIRKMLILGKKMGLKRTHRDVTWTFCIGIMHPAREFSSTSKTLQCTLLRRQTATSFLLGAPRNHPKGHYFETIDNIQSAVTESPEEENSRYSCESGRTSRGIYFRGDNRNCHGSGNSRTFRTVREDPEKIKDILFIFTSSFYYYRYYQKRQEIFKITNKSYEERDRN